MKKKILPIASVFLVILIVIIIIFTSHSQYRRAILCNQFVGNYLNNPPTNIEDYTSQDSTFNEFCGPDNLVYFVLVNLVLVGGLIYLLKKRQFRKKLIGLDS